MQYSTLFEQALAHFPYELTATGITQGDFEPHASYGIEYAEEHTFEVGRLLDMRLMAGGWIELRQDQDDEEPTITGFFGIARNGDWKEGSVLGEYQALQGQYNPDAQSWELWIDQY